MFELVIQNNKNLYQPAVLDGIKWETDRKGSPGRLTFSIINDDILKFEEGNPVKFKLNDTNVFYGFVFKKDRNKENIINVTAYDQLRYLKNKDTYVYKNKTASEFLKMIAADFNLKLGEIEDTAFKIASRIEDNATLFDMIQNALDITLQNNKKMYVLYDNFGKLTLKNIESMRVKLMIDEESGENYSYSSTIDGETYNKIKLSFENKESGKREIYITQDSSNINKWGVLQYFDTIDEKVNGKNMAETLIQLFNKKTNNLTISDIFGDIRVRAGSSVLVKLDLGDFKIRNFMLVEKAQHTFNKDDHRMTLTLRGGGFN